MDIIVKKATDSEVSEMRPAPTWECEASEFDWHYDSEERCLVTQGSATVEYEGSSVSFGAGDYVIFPKGLSCVWKVAAPIKKHYVFK